MVTGGTARFEPGVKRTPGVAAPPVDQPDPVAYTPSQSWRCRQSRGLVGPASVFTATDPATERLIETISSHLPTRASRCIQHARTNARRLLIVTDRKVEAHRIRTAAGAAPKLKCDQSSRWNARVAMPQHGGRSGHRASHRDHLKPSAHTMQADVFNTRARMHDASLDRDRSKGRGTAASEL